MKIKKSDLLNMIQEQNNVIDSLIHQVNCHHKDIVRLESIIEPEPQLKQLTQSVFDGLEEKWRFAAVDSDGGVWVYLRKPINDDTGFYLAINERNYIGENYDTSNWRNSLIERDDIAKKLAEVDLSSELTGSELCKAMLARGDKYVLCYASDLSDKYAVENRGRINLMTHTDGDGIFSNRARWRNAVPINQRTGEPLTAAEVGL